MLALYPLESIPREPGALLLSYSSNLFDNLEWRPCVEKFLAEVATLGLEVIPVSVPPFKPTEDFVEVVYSIDGVRTSFQSDHLLSVIEITSDDPRVLREAWGSIGDRLGWA